MKKTKKITYRKQGQPCIILEGCLLTEKYGLEIGDRVNVEYNKNHIKISKIKHD